MTRILAIFIVQLALWFLPVLALGLCVDNAALSGVVIIWIAASAFCTLCVIGGEANAHG